MTFEDDLHETMALLEANGANVDNIRSRVFLPLKMVMAQAEKAPEQVVLSSRDMRYCFNPNDMRKSFLSLFNAR